MQRCLHNANLFTGLLGEMLDRDKFERKVHRPIIHFDIYQAQQELSSRQIGSRGTFRFAQVSCRVTSCVAIGATKVAFIVGYGADTYRRIATRALLVPHLR
jgi:hypothetical protein